MNPLLKIYEERKMNKSDILAVIEAIEKWARENDRVQKRTEDLEHDWYGNEGYNDAIRDLLHFLHEAREEIKNSDKE